MGKFVTIDLEKRKLQNPRAATTEQLIEKVSEFAGIANNRLRALEKASKRASRELGQQVDFTRYGAYAYAKKFTKDRVSTRFRGGKKGRKRGELIKEYEALEKFLSLKTSLVQGVTQSLLDKYKDFKKMLEDEKSPFDLPDFQSFYDLMARAWEGNLKAIFGSQVVEIAVKIGHINVLEAIREEVEYRNIDRGKLSYNDIDMQDPTDEFKTEALDMLAQIPIGQYILAGVTKK